MTLPVPPDHPAQSVHQSPLGQQTDYPEQYAPDILFGIPRQSGRAQLRTPLSPAVAQGTDYWHVFELSWLSPLRMRQVAMARLTFDAASPALIESKSLKLYFNSLNFEIFADQAALIQTVTQDLGRVSGALVHCELFGLDAMPVGQWTGLLLDQQIPAESLPSAGRDSLRYAAHTGESGNVNATIEETLITHLFRSNCPVTGQPDWASLRIRYHGRAWDHAALLGYLCGFERHCAFHEQCVEDIFNTLWQMLQPVDLMVQAAFTRRGGLDINPVRASRPDWLPPPVRLSRQ